MITKYSYDNIETMINSIHSNSELINSMVKRTKANDREIKGKMTSYANTKGVFSQDQVTLYKSYINNREDLEGALNTYSEEIKKLDGTRILTTEISHEEGNVNSIHSVFNKINSLQIKVMEMLCAIIGSANLLLSAI